MDEYISKIIKIIRKLGMEIKILSGWGNIGIGRYEDSIDILINDCLIILVDNDEHYEMVNKRKINDIEIKEQFIWEQIWKPKIFTFCSYFREFITLLMKFIKGDKELRSNKYLEYWTHLIFKTGFYLKNKIFTDKNDILNELKVIKAVLSEPLHAYSVAYNIDGVCTEENINKSCEYNENIDIKKLNFTNYWNDNNLNYEKMHLYSSVEYRIQSIFEIIQKYEINEESLSKKILDLSIGVEEEYLKYSLLPEIDKESYDLENFLMWVLELSSRHKKGFDDVFSYMLSKRKNKIGVK